MRANLIAVPFVLALTLLTASDAFAGDALEEGFRAPPDSAKPHTWWHWMNGNITCEGITADLEAMKKGQAVEWRLAGVFVNTPFDMTAALDLSEPAAAAGAILSQLIHR